MLHYFTSSKLNDKMCIRSDDCPSDERWNTRNTCCLPLESFQEYSRPFSSNPQNPESNLAAGVVAVAPSPNSGDDPIEGIPTNLQTTPEQIPANTYTPDGVYSFLMNGGF